MSETAAGYISRGEQVDHELDAMIRRRDEKRRVTEGERLEREVWQEISQREDAKEESRRMWEWVRFFEGQSERAERNGAEIAATNRAEALQASSPAGHRHEHNGRRGEEN